MRKMRFNRNVIILNCVLIASSVIAMRPSIVEGWGPEGHEISGRAAAMKLPQEMPQFFRKSVDQLGYLNNEPDRWRDRTESTLDKAMSQAAAADHFIDLEMVPPIALDGVNRYDYAEQMIKIEKKPTQSGFVPYRILELFGRVRVQFRLWRAENDSKKREWIEARVVNDAGILGHYVADAANPHHTTIHYNGWTGINPNGYTKFTQEPNQGIHYRFEEEFVKTHIQLKDVLPLIGEKARLIENPREEIWKYLRNSNSLVEQVYI